MKVRFNRGALRDLEDIFAYIAADNPHAAAAMVRRIDKTAALIGFAPEIGVTTRRPHFRTFPVGIT